MLTPFDTKGEIDWASLERLVDWYIDAGVHGLFAACQSSEMFYLSDEETQALTRFIVEKRMEEYLLLLLVIRQRP